MFPPQHGETKSTKITRFLLWKKPEAVNNRLKETIENNKKACRWKLTTPLGLVLVETDIESVDFRIDGLP